MGIKESPGLMSKKPAMYQTLTKTEAILHITDGHIEQPEWQKGRTRKKRMRQRTRAREILWEIFTMATQARIFWYKP